MSSMQPARSVGRSVVLGLLVLGTLVLVIRHLDGRRAEAARARLNAVLEVKSLRHFERHVGGADNAALWLGAASMAVGPADPRSGLDRVERTGGCGFLDDGPAWARELLSENRVALEAAHLAEAATDSSYAIDYGNGNRLRWPNLVQQLHLSRLLHLEGRVQLCDGDVEGALVATRTLRQLRDSLNREPFSIFQLIGIAIGNRYLWLAREWLALQQPPKEVLRELASTSPSRDVAATASQSLSLEARLAASAPPSARGGFGRRLLMTATESLLARRQRAARSNAYAARLERLHEGDLSALDVTDNSLVRSSPQLGPRLLLDNTQRQLLRAAVQLRLGDVASEAIADNAFTLRPLVVDRDAQPPSVSIPGALEQWRGMVGLHVDANTAPVFELPIGPMN